MRVPTLLLSVWTLLFIYVQANNNSIGYEILYYYYVYKMEFDSGRPPTMGYFCRSEPGTGKALCTFEEFVHDIMQPDFLEKYKPKSGSSAFTTSPAEDAAEEVSNVNIKSLRYSITKLCSTFTKQTKIAETIRGIQTIAEEILENYGGDEADKLAREASKYGKAVILKRSEQAADGLVDAVKEFIGEEARGYLVDDRTYYDWEASLEAIDDAVDDEKITQQHANGLKNEIRAFSVNMRTAPEALESDRNHIMVMQEFQVCVTQLDELAGTDIDNEEDSGDELQRMVDRQCNIGFTKRAAFRKRAVTKRTTTGTIAARGVFGLSKRVNSWAKGRRTANMRVLSFKGEL